MSDKPILYDFDAVIIQAIQEKASDVLFQTESTPHFIVDGKPRDSHYPKITPDTITDIKSMVLQGKPQLLEQLENGEHQVDCSYTVRQKLSDIARLRVSLCKCEEGEEVVCRLIPMHVPSLEEYKMPKVFSSISEEITGMVIVSGVTGSGKSTTIAAMIEHINNNREAHVITLEDPIEFMHKPNKCFFTRREIGLHTPDFAKGLRAALRQAPHVILVGEMRDTESIRFGLLAAETGHLVFSTVHSESVCDIPERMISTFPEGEQEQVRRQISDVGLAFIAQQLVPEKDGSGRAGAYEILVMNAASRNLIREKKCGQLENVMQTEVRFGCSTMSRALMALYDQGRISEENLIRYSSNKETARKHILESTNGDIDVAQPPFFRREIL